MEGIYGIGVLFLVIGGISVLRYAGLGIPSCIFSWKIPLIAIGIFIGLKEGFRGLSWIILIAHRNLLSAR